MSGQIINPFSSDFNPTSSISFSAEPVPLVAYGLIGITALTLAYVTLVEISQGDSSNVSAVSLLPKIDSSSPSTSLNRASPGPGIFDRPAAQSGGKTHHKRPKNKGTKRKLLK
jgi:hypothetical protein